MKKRFTLIELVVVIVILGILAAIVIPNVSNFKKEADLIAIQSNVRNLQTSVDMYGLDYHGTLPGYTTPKVGEPSPINFNKLQPEYTRTLPKNNVVKYWVDYKGKVWASTVDSPTQVKSDGVKLTWQDASGAVSYNVYEVLDSVGGNVSVSNTDFKLIEANIKDFSYPVSDSRIYAVSSIDEEGFETPPATGNYLGYDEYVPLTNDDNTEETIPETPSEPIVPKVDDGNYSGKYVVLDVEGNLGLDSYTTISEVVIYDIDGNVIPYIPLAAYDTVSGVPFYWNDSMWNKSNLNDGSTYYVDNYSGSHSTTVLGHANSPSLNFWGRIALDLQSQKQIGQVVVYAGSPEKRIPKTIRVYTSEVLDIAKNLEQRDTQELSLLDTISFNGTELTVKPYSSTNEEYVDTRTDDGILNTETRHLVFELEGDHGSGDGYTTITEIEIFDKNGAKIPYTTLDRYEPPGQYSINYWTSSAWSKLNLNDGDLRYSNNSSGNQSSTVFFGQKTSNPWARFAIDLGSNKEIGSIKAWVGSPERRNAVNLKVFKVNSYTPSSQLNLRSNDGLEFMSKVDIPKEWLTPQPLTFK